MKKLILLFLLTTMSRLVFGQIYFTFDSIANPRYICQAHSFDVEVFGMVSGGSTHYGSQSFLVRNDTIFAQFHFVSGSGPATPYPLYRKINMPAPLIFGQYKIIAQGIYNGQVHKTLTSAISICSGISGISKAEKSELQVSVFPNPVLDLLQVTMPHNKSSMKLTLTNVIGTTVQTKTLPAGTLQTLLSLKTLPAGIYLLQVSSGSGKKITQKIIKY